MGVADRRAPCQAPEGRAPDLANQMNHGSDPRSVLSQLCDPGQISKPLCSSHSSTVNLRVTHPPCRVVGKLQDQCPWRAQCTVVPGKL